MFSSDKRKKLFVSDKSYFVMKSKVVGIVKEVIACGGVYSDTLMLKIIGNIYVSNNFQSHHKSPADATSRKKSGS